ASVSLRTLEMRDFRGLTLPPLPGTALESARLEALAKQSGWPAEIHLGANATEPELQQVRSPHILHLATHGFFLPETEEEKDGGLRSGERSYMTERGVGGISPIEEFGGERMRPVALKNPMHRSGLALAGAQRTLEAWARGEVPPTDNDGIVTAEEVGGLKLDGTWLVVLSACDTGTGEARAGEGVLGLRRGFIQAGAQNLLMTLWAVADEETVKLMTDFYAAAQTSRNAPQALANVQRDWLVRLRRERGLQTAIRIAGPFIMSSQGPVQ
ncbi:MAG: CHAT domain-containing protein, partial [Verrucomicrobia bacterium]|nr:CHAT domain-containing protein [Verrucomicrobiota bacterium]